MRYAEDTLRDAARELGLLASMDVILNMARKTMVPGTGGWRDERLRTAAKAVTLSGNLEKILDYLSLKSPPSGTFTARELEEYFRRRQAERNIMGGARHEAQRILEDIESHREPEYPEGIVVRDACAIWYCRRGSGWLGFGTSVIVGFTTPVRPLEVKS